MRSTASVMLLLAAVGFIGLTSAFSTNFDFRAFYCAGAALQMHADPYHTEPLHTCERTQTDKTYARFARETALPAPQPPYDLAAFSLLAALPFAVASKLWTSLLLACALGTILLVQRLCRAPVTVVLAALWLSLCMTSIYLGELIPICACAVAAAAYFAKESRWAAAGIAAAVTLVEPHIGLPVCAAMAIWAPRARLPLALSGAVLGLVALAASGVSQNIEYFWSVLPAHALAEIGSDAQLSFSAVLHAMGASNAMALRFGSISFFMACCAGVLIARSLMERYRDAAFVAATPAAFAVMGGVFIHVTDMAVAIPLVLLLLHYAREGRGLLMATLVLLAIPWWSLATPMLLGQVTGVSLTAVTVTFLLLNYSDHRLLALSAGIAAFAAAALLVQWYAVAANALPPSHAEIIAIDPIYPEASWASFNARHLSSGLLPAWLLRVPTWSGLFFLATFYVSFARSHRPAAPQKS